MHFERPYLHFAWGWLVFDTDNVPSSYAYKNQAVWNHHVAPIIRINDMILYVLDPGISAVPLLKNQWHDIMTRSMDKQSGIHPYITGYVTCRTDAYYLAHSDCINPSFDFLDDFEHDIQENLNGYGIFY